MIFKFMTRKMLKQSGKINQQPSVNVTCVQRRHRKTTIYENQSRSYLYLAFYSDKMKMHRNNTNILGKILMYKCITVLYKYTGFLATIYPAIRMCENKNNE